MTLQEILAMDTSKMSLDEMVNMLDGPGGRPDYQNNIRELRLRHEDDTDIPMEEDSIGRQCRELGRTMLPEPDKASWNGFPSISIDRQTRDDSCRCPGGDGRQRRFLHYFLSQRQ